MNTRFDKWAAGDAYDTYMGRWSRRVADPFLEWLAPAPGGNWLEVGCGTGALTQAVYHRAEPASLVACDPSADFVSFARNSMEEASVTFLVAGADDLPRREGGFDIVVSGLVLNFLDPPAVAVRSMRERIRSGGRLAAYVWDYAEGMQFLRFFWAEAAALDPSAAQLDEGRRFPLCRTDSLIQLFEQAGMSSVESTAFQIDTAFPDFEAYWSPFLGGTGPAPSYVDSLSQQARAELKLRLQQRLASSTDGSIRLTARALGVRGLVTD